VPTVDAFLHGTGELIGIDETESIRQPLVTREAGGLVEAGVRLKGRAGVLELFAGFEKRIDADPLDFKPHTGAWPAFGSSTAEGMG